MLAAGADPLGSSGESVEGQLLEPEDRFLKAADYTPLPTAMPQRPWAAQRPAEPAVPHSAAETALPPAGELWEPAAAAAAGSGQASAAGVASGKAGAAA